MMKRVYIYELILVTISVLIITACSATTKYQVLSTLFDGVPDPNAKQKEIADTVITAAQVPPKKTNLAEVKKPEFIYHPPYQNRMCSACHNMQLGNALIKPIPDLCYKCHENLTGKNPALHGPVAMGECSVCHSPHLSKNKFLLVRKGRELCLHCHEATYVFENKNHFATEEYACLDCHDPHSGKDRFLLVK